LPVAPRPVPGRGRLFIYFLTRPEPPWSPSP